MSDFVTVARKDELKDDAMKKVRAGDRDLLLALVAGRYYCTDSRCPHMGGDLSKGVLNGTIIECPLHHSQFDLADGRVVRWATGLRGKIRGPAPLKAYEVRLEGDSVQVRL